MSAQPGAAAAHRTPVIGIGGIPMRCRFADVWDRDVVMLHRSYLDAITRAGAVAVILAPSSVLQENPAAPLDLLDGLILAGGSDIEPSQYGQTPHPKLGTVDPLRDRCELALAREALARDLPILGICRGMELLNVAVGGTLIQHLPDAIGHDAHLRSAGTFESHAVQVLEASLTAKLVGPDQQMVHSHHHQAVDRLGECVAATAWDHERQVVEAIEITDARLALGVQWHPEEDAGSGLIERFISEITAQQQNSDH